MHFNRKRKTYCWLWEISSERPGWEGVFGNVDAKTDFNLIIFVSE
jgi:hypothetical protein